MEQTRGGTDSAAGAGGFTVGPGSSRVTLSPRVGTLPLRQPLVPTGAASTSSSAGGGQPIPTMATMRDMSEEEARNLGLDYVRTILPSLYTLVGTTLRGDPAPDFLRRSCDGEAGIVHPSHHTSNTNSTPSADEVLAERRAIEAELLALEEKEQEHQLSLRQQDAEQQPQQQQSDCQSTEAALQRRPSLARIVYGSPHSDKSVYAVPLIATPLTPTGPVGPYSTPYVPLQNATVPVTRITSATVTTTSPTTPTPPTEPATVGGAYVDYNAALEAQRILEQQQQQQRPTPLPEASQVSESVQTIQPAQPKLKQQQQQSQPPPSLTASQQAIAKQAQERALKKQAKVRDEVESDRLFLPATLNKKSDSCSWNERFQVLQNRLFSHTMMSEAASHHTVGSTHLNAECDLSLSPAVALTTTPHELLARKKDPRKQKAHYVCTYAKSGANFIEQRVFECRSCGLVDGDCCCAACAIVCHPPPQHDCSFTHYSLQSYCDCGASGKCKALVPPSPDDHNHHKEDECTIGSADEEVPVTQQERLISILNLYSSIGNLYKEFLRTAKLYAKIIISEKYSETKTVEPVDVGGLVGGRKYIAEGILFKFAYDVAYGTSTIYNGDSNAMKSAGHELKSLNAIQQLQIPGLCFPLMCVIDYRGFRVTAMSVLPINKQTLIYGSADAGLTVVGVNKVMNRNMALVGRRLNLRTHIAGRIVTKYIGVPGDIEGHLGKDQRFYVIDFSRLFPPEPPTLQGSFLYRLLRQELVQQSPKPLCADAFSAFQMTDPRRNEWNTDVASAYAWLLKEKVVEFARFLESFETETLEEKEKINLTVELHKMGINVRFLGPIYEALESLYWRERVMTEMVIRVAKCTLRVFLRRTMARIHLATEEPYICVAVDFLNLLMGLSAESLDYWNGSLRRSINATFFYHEGCTRRSKREQLRTQIHTLRLLEETLARTGVKLQPWVVIINSHPVNLTPTPTELLTTTGNLAETDIVGSRDSSRFAKIQRQYGGHIKKITKKLLRQEQPFEERDVESVRSKIKAMRLLDSIAPFNCYKSFLLSDDPADIEDCLAAFEARHDAQLCSYFHAFVWAKAYFHYWRFSGGTQEVFVEKAVGLVCKVAFDMVELEAALTFDPNFFEMLREEADKCLEEGVQALQLHGKHMANSQITAIDPLYLFKCASYCYQGLAVVHSRLQDSIHFEAMLKHIIDRIKMYPGLYLGAKLDPSMHKDIIQSLSWVYHNPLFAADQKPV
eukprot:TRINITY_DN2656_c0_g1_i1.p1 TRINITY_DN2656_c0_g1~~TRINITY_DN2656_c0_g1_i1.p1  ORF type:complete len:1242 (+),score=212.82 TRINITY_DN2656_c0_g1_i1:20-3745(+)